MAIQLQAKEQENWLNLTSPPPIKVGIASSRRQAKHLTTRFTVRRGVAG